MHAPFRWLVTLILVCVCAVTDPMFVFSAAGSQSHPPASQPAPVVNISVDPRIELLLIVQHLTGDYEKRTRLITDFDLRNLGLNFG